MTVKELVETLILFDHEAEVVMKLDGDILRIGDILPFNNTVEIEVERYGSQDSI